MANKQSRNGAHRSVPPLADLLTDQWPAQASERHKEDRISFAGDWPAGGIPSVRQAIETARGRADGAGAEVGRSTYPGSERLRELLAGRLAGRGLPVEAGDLGLAPQGEPVIAWIARGLLRPGDAVLVESPAPPACLQAFRSAGAVVVQVPCDEEGMRPEDAERLAEAHRPKLAHVMPALGNPAGRIWSAARRETMLDLGRRFGVVLLEDGAYGEWRNDEAEHGAEREASLYAMSAKTADGGVIYAGTFAAALGPELPVGWAAADPGILARLAALPRTPAAEEPDAGRSAEEMLFRLLEGGEVDPLLRQLSVSYSERMYRLDALLRERHWSGASWTLPNGGPFLWLTLPEGLDADALLRAAEADGVVFDPGAPFYAADPPRNRLRLSVAGAAVDRLDEGFARLAGTVDAFLARS
ncbi:2-aminoadipate transaminase [Paenibacillus sp. UNC496MF]|uniref:aminotransferase-like domain-containing protein n=1 Tax=Paenibacillus sp. UNC496MF TaxID=1502753 RepID=UPI0008F0CADA|nr:PLP-dependent aminotransferase family protein [Paenibacillus sp. UNC496MF]SFI92290.1 2-aminoadipate transaminase [Paenibacillus sp. UNC496MF]